MSNIERQSIRAKRHQKENTEQMETKEQVQNDILTGIIDPESRTYTFEQTMSVCGEKKTGTFKAKYLGIAARLKIGTIRARLLEGAPEASLDQVTDDISFMMAYLSVALIEKPSWFDYETLDDINELTNLWREVMTFMSTFRLQNESASNAGNSTAATGKKTVENK